MIPWDTLAQVDTVCPIAHSRLPDCPYPLALCPIAARWPRAKVWSSRTVKGTYIIRREKGNIMEILNWKSGATLVRTAVSQKSKSLDCSPTIMPIRWKIWLFRYLYNFWDPPLPEKKYVSDSGFFSWITALIPSPVGERFAPASAPARGHGGVPEGIFKVPSRLRGSGRWSPHKNQSHLFIWESQFEEKRPLGSKKQYIDYRVVRFRLIRQNSQKLMDKICAFW